jgi:hypothetical protein
MDERLRFKKLKSEGMTSNVYMFISKVRIENSRKYFKRRSNL